MTLKITYKSMLLMLLTALWFVQGNAQNLMNFQSSSGYKLSTTEGILSKMNKLKNSNAFRDTSGYEFYTHQYKGINVPFDAVTDSDGNIFVTGTSSDFETVRGNFVTIKVNNSGNQVWEKRQSGTKYAAEIGMTLALDADNNPVVSGTVWNGHDMDLVTMKYDATNGEIIWQTTYGGQAQGMDVPSAIAIAPDGSVVVTGITYSGNNITWLTLKYSSTGTILWSEVENNPLPDTWIEPQAIHINSDGKIGITGFNGNDGYWQCYYTVVYNADGSIAWSNQYEDENALDVNSLARSITSDLNGNWYVTGTFNTNSPLMRTLKYSSGGVLDWTDSQVMTEELSDGYSVETSGTGDIYAAGRHFGNWIDDGTVLISYNEDGTRKWTALTNDLIDVKPVKFTLDQVGNPVISGWGSDPETWNNIIKATRYSTEGIATGGFTYVQQSSEFGGFTDFMKLNMDGADDAYLSFASFYTNLGGAFEVMKIPFVTGITEWDFIYSNENASRSQLLTAYTDANNNTYATGRYDSITFNYLLSSYIIVKYNNVGEVVWEKVFNELNGPMVNGIQARVTPSGDVVVYLLPMDGIIRIKKYNTSGDLLWETEKAMINPAMFTLLLDEQGNVILAGSAFENESDLTGKFATVKFASASGEELWTRYTIREGHTDDSFGITVGTTNSLGDIFLGGTAGTGGWFDQALDMVAIKYNAAGELQWLNTFAKENKTTGARGMMVNDDGDIYINGYQEDRETYEQQMTITRIQADGTTAWEKIYGEDGRRVMSYKMVQLSTGELIISGFSVIDGLNNKVILVKLDEQGNQISVIETDYNRFFYDMYLDDADNLYVLNQVAGSGYPYRPYYSAGSMPLAGLFTVKIDETTTEELFYGPELSDFYPAMLVPLKDGRLLMAGTISNEFSMFEGFYFWQSHHVVVGTSNFETAGNAIGGQNTPNPAKGNTEIPINLKSASNIVINIYDLTGRIAMVAYNGQLPAGHHMININVEGLEKGMYLYEVNSGEASESYKMLIK
ncbi:MAG: T9SS type A sorting domain-containing protein [Omnitrophica WOR_2 bacterium]